MEDSANKKWEEFRKNYCANRPCEPFCSDNEAEMWFEIACYAEENIKRAFFEGYTLGKELSNKVNQGEEEEKQIGKQNNY